MHWFDLATIGINIISVAFGAWRGLVRIAFSVAAVVGGLAVAKLFQPEVGRWLSGWIGCATANMVAYVGLLLATMVVIGLVGRLITRLLVISDVNWVDRVAGAGLGHIGGVLVVSGLYAAVALVPPAGTAPLRGSVLAPYVAEFTRQFQNVMPPAVRDFLRREKERLLEQLPSART